MLIPKTVFYCTLALILGAALGFWIRPSQLKYPGEWQAQRLAIASITQTKPHDEIRQKSESELILRQATTSNMSPSEYSAFLVALDKIKLQHANESLRSLVVFHDFAKERFNTPKDKEHAEFLDFQLSQSGEVYVIHSQLLEREIAAIQAWKPGLAAEQCLAIADSQIHR